MDNIESPRLQSGMTLEELAEFNEDVNTKFEKKEITSLDYWNRRMFALFEIGGSDGLAKINDRLQKMGL